MIVEPGTPAGWQRILDARAALIAQGAHIAAPCAHQQECPLVAPDWCHFSRRVARSRIHRLTKDAEVPWEDEKFIYLAATRDLSLTAMARVIAPTRIGGGKVTLKLCNDDGSAEERLVTKRDGEFSAGRVVPIGAMLCYEACNAVCNLGRLMRNTIAAAAKHMAPARISAGV